MELIDVPSVKDVVLVNADDEIKDLGEFFVNLIPLAWAELFSLYEKELRVAGKTIQKKFLEKGYTLCPEPCDVFRALALCPWMDAKVVIIGQDPYYLMRDGLPSATGCCFECRKGNPIERSLETILMVLGMTINKYKIPEDGDLTKWAMQGVLLLNTTLTTNYGTPNAHSGIWQFFPVRVLDYLSKMRKNVVYMLWGK
ncbi:MAG: hypothetical protein ACMG6E_05580, partial [Candidatus Roizmanbacteria bacterium]